MHIARQQATRYYGTLHNYKHTDFLQLQTINSSSRVPNVHKGDASKW